MGFFHLYKRPNYEAISYYTEGLKKLREELDYLKVLDAS
jgi:hypothetical protein